MKIGCEWEIQNVLNRDAGIQNFESLIIRIFSGDRKLWMASQLFCCIGQYNAIYKCDFHQIPSTREDLCFGNSFIFFNDFSFLIIFFQGLNPPPRRMLRLWSTQGARIIYWLWTIFKWIFLVPQIWSLHMG